MKHTELWTLQGMPESGRRISSKSTFPIYNSLMAFIWVLEILFGALHGLCCRCLLLLDFSALFVSFSNYRRDLQPDQCKQYSLLYCNGPFFGLPLTLSLYCQEAISRTCFRSAICLYNVFCIPCRAHLDNILISVFLSFLIFCDIRWLTYLYSLPLCGKVVFLLSTLHADTFIFSQTFHTCCNQSP